ncbi:MAG: ParB/RepB/Spo0J family partition protein, partial [Gammaproteobacteria bacterium]
MSKDGDFLDLDFLENQVVRKDNDKNPSREVASPAARMVSDSKRDSILGRTMKRRDDRRDLEKKISELEGQLKVSQNSLVLDMPVSKVRVKFTKTLVDPEEIDVSPENQRVQELLDKESVRDIYESILNEGQAEPGFLRRKPNGRYELISGSRRLYCVKQIEDRQYLALVGDIPDVDVRRLSRLENQQSPISVYERSLSFKHDVDGKRVKSWDALAALEGMSQRQIMKYKALSELPVEIVRSFPSPSDLSLVFSDWIISKIRSSDAVKQRFIEIA